MAGEVDTFVYDGECGLCRSAVAWLRPRAASTTRFLPATPVLLDELGLTREETDHAAILVTAAGARFDGSLAIAAVLRGSSGRGRTLIGRLLLHQPFRAVGERVYGWVATNRHRLRCGSRCRLDR